MAQKESSNEKKKITSSLRITLIYIFFGSLWILFSDKILFVLVDSDHELFTHISIYKGWAFIAVTGALLYWLIKQADAEQQRIADKLRKNEKKFHSILNRATDAIFVCNREGCLIDVNREACRMLGYSHEELMRMSPADVDATFFVGKSVNEIESCLALNQSFLSEGMFRRKDDSLFPVETHLGMFEVDSQPVILAVARDITDRKKAKQAMEQAAREWAAAMDASDDAICLVDTDRRLLRANSTFYRLSGISAEEWIGHPVKDILHPDGEPTSCPLCAALQRMEDSVIEMDAGHPDNHMGKPFEIMLKIVRDEVGQPLSMLISLHDLTNVRRQMEERDRLESQLRQAQKMEAIGTLAGGIAHDFNNILTGILGYAQLIREGLKIGKASMADIEQVIESSLRARDLVKCILAFSRKSDYKTVPIAPHLAIEESLKLLKSTIPSSIEIRQDIDKDCGLIKANPSQLQQIVLNLCNNARHSMEQDQGVLVVSLQRKVLRKEDIEGERNIMSGVFAELTVSDTGHGMDKETMGRIFEPYFTTKEFGKGTGLGLSIVHGLVHDIGGMIKVMSEIGEGTTFHVYFPVISEHMITSTEEQQEDVPRGHERVLLVDDETLIVDYEKVVLESLGYQVTATTSSIEAWEIFRSNPYGFDLLVTDQTMPAMAGTELAKMSLALRPDLPVILCSGYSKVINDEKAKKIGIRLLAMKPFDHIELARHVRKVLDERSPL